MTNTSQVIKVSMTSDEIMLIVCTLQDDVMTMVPHFPSLKTPV